jgi:2-dehydropantoate 2-reductase
MRIAIMGTGGVGAYVGANLQSADEEVFFIARGAHLHALRQYGLRIECPIKALVLERITATDDPATIGPVELILFTVKLGDTDAAARALHPLIGSQTRIVTLQNGIDSVQMISRHVAGAQVRAGAIYVSAVIDRPGVIRSPGGLHLVVVDAAEGDPVVAAFCAACNRSAALEAQASNAIEGVLWEKFIALSAVSATTSLLRASMGQILANPECRMLQRQLIDEGVAVARAAAKKTREDLADYSMRQLEGLPAAFRSSMSEDLARGKPLELHWLSGKIHRLGLQYGVPTPAHSTVYRALVLYEHGNPA